jgi:DNA-binding Xre family transcriptional regulator
MSQTRPLIDTLKQELRKQRLTYKQVSEVLDLSETSVKRLFSEEAFSIKRLEKVCELLHLSISDLVYLMEQNTELTTELTREQEEELVSDIKLLLVAMLLVNKLKFSDILLVYDISETEGIRLLNPASGATRSHENHRTATRQSRQADDFTQFPMDPGRPDPTVFRAAGAAGIP